MTNFRTIIKKLPVWVSKFIKKCDTRKIPNMSATHLTVGSQQPPKEEGKLRLYSMEYCPYAHRTRLVLRAKNIPHDIVNINLINKPEWYFNIHPEGKVPALDTGSEIVVESLDISDYLDEKYPTPALYPSDPEEKQQDKDLIQKIGDVSGTFARCLLGQEKKSAAEWAQDFAPVLDVFEKELEKRQKQFFGGNIPGMVDYMLWPWAERSGTVAIALGERLPFEDGQFERLRAWKKAMKDNPTCAGIYHGPEKFWKVVQFKLRNLPPDYDNV